MAAVEQPYQEKQDFPVPLEISLIKEQIVSLVKAWLDDGVLKKVLPPKPFTQQEMRDPKLYIYY